MNLQNMKSYAKPTGAYFWTDFLGQISKILIPDFSQI